MFKNKISHITNYIVDTIYPPKCISCFAYVYEHGNICANCWDKITFIDGSSCEICGFPFDYTVEPGAICAGCISKKPYFHKSRSVFLYDEGSSWIVTSFKYNDKIENKRTYAKLMMRSGKMQISEADLLIPVPIYFRKLLLRKYNQSALLSKEIARMAKKPCIVRGLICKKEKKTQVGSTRDARIRNIKGAYAVNKKYISSIQNKNLLLIDDVITTGATANECAKVLLKQGAARVDVLTLAKTL